MAFSRPTLSEIVERIKSDIETRLSTGKLTPRSFLSIIATALGGAAHLLHGHIVWATQQLFPDTAELEYLERWASIWGVERTAAVFATGSIDVTGTNGTVIPTGTRFKRSDGVFYVTTASETIAAGVASIAAKAVNAGEEGNAEATTSLSLVNSLSGLNSDAEVASGGITNGADSETDASLRERLLDRIKQPPHGGAEFDYIKWAKEVSGVTRAWAYPLANGAGSVTLTFVLDDEADIIPDAAKVQEVQDYIDDENRRPVTAAVTVFAPTAVDLDFTIALTPDTSEVRAAVEQSLKELLERDAEPGGTILISRIREAVSVAAGESDNTVTTPSADVTHTTGQIATFGTITWS